MSASSSTSKPSEMEYTLTSSSKHKKQEKKSDDNEKTRKNDDSHESQSKSDNSDDDDDDDDDDDESAYDKSVDLTCGSIQNSSDDDEESIDSDYKAFLEDMIDNDEETERTEKKLYERFKRARASFKPQARNVNTGSFIETLAYQNACEQQLLQHISNALEQPGSVSVSENSFRYFCSRSLKMVLITTANVH